MLTADNHRIPTPAQGSSGEPYHLSEDLAELAMRMIHDQQQVGGQGLHRALLRPIDQGWDVVPMLVAEMLEGIDEIGGPDSDVHDPIGWGMASNAPFRRWKRDTHRGGNTDPLVVRWPRHLTPEQGGTIRSQYLYVTNLYPSILEAASVTPPRMVNGIAQRPLSGHSMLATLRDAATQTGRRVQCFEMLGSRAIWADGWTAVAWHRLGSDWADEQWELYHQDKDYTQAHDLAAQHPEKLQELIALWWVEARKYQVLPRDDRGREKAVDPMRPRAMTWTKNRLGRWLARGLLGLGLSIGLHAAGSTADKRTPAPELGTLSGPEAQAFYLGLNAVIWGYPAVFFEDLIRDRTEPDAEAKTGNPRAQVNQFGLVRHLRGPEFKQIATPNNNTLYAQAFVDASREPIVLSVPALDKNRYYVMQLWGPNGDTFAYIGSRTTGRKAGTSRWSARSGKGACPRA